jgi:hypothetical protein
VAATGPGNVWAAGYTVSSSGKEKFLVLRWQDGVWTVVPSPSPTGDAALQAVAAISARDAWVVGLTRPTTCRPRCRTLIEHWNGTAWMKVPSPDPHSRYLNAFLGVATLNGHDAWAVGTTDYDSTLIAQWNGKAWK